MRQPGETIEEVEQDGCDLPAPGEGIDKEDVPTEWNEGVVHNVGVLQVDDGVLDVVAGVDQHLTLAVEFHGLRRLVHLVRALQILCSSLSQL